MTSLTHRGKFMGMAKTWEKVPVEFTFLHIYRKIEESAFKWGILECLRGRHPTATPQFKDMGEEFYAFSSVFPDKTAFSRCT